MKTIPRNVKKAFLISSFIGSVLKAHTTGTPILTALHIRVDQGMKRYSILVGKKAYYDLTEAGLGMWSKLSKKHSTKLTHEETEVFIEYMGYLLKDKDYKDFLGFTHFKSTITMRDTIKFKRVCNSVIALGEEVDAYLGTKPCVSQVKVVKVKVKSERDKAKPKVLKKIRNRAKWNRGRIE